MFVHDSVVLRYKTCNLKIKKILPFIFTLFLIGPIPAQDNSFRPTYIFEGILKKNNEVHKIRMNFLILLDSSIVGSYYYDAKNGSLDLAGKLYSDNSFTLSEFFENKNTGTFKGKLSWNKKKIKGTWVSEKGNKYSFDLDQIEDESYWSILKKNRSLFEYKDFNSISKNQEKVLSVDFENKNLNILPDEFSRLTKIQSINLLGNNFTVFPRVLFKLKTLDEISLSSNKLKNIDPEIRNLQNLKILILNNNNLKELPKEIGELRSLKYLELGNNQISTIPDEIKNLQKLEEMHIERNHLSDKEKKKLKNLLPNCVIYL